MLSFVKSELLCLLCYVIAQHRAAADEQRPYEFSFNIVDFQHRYEKKDSEGIITGEYGFITADGVYHETGYTTDKSGDFIITRQRNRKITSLKDAQEIFKDRPEAAKKLAEAVVRACGSCKLLTKEEIDRTKSNRAHTKTKIADAQPPRKMSPISKQMLKTLSETAEHADASAKGVSQEKSQSVREESGTSGARARNQSAADAAKGTARIAKKLPERNDSDATVANGRAAKKMIGDLRYRFNYTITSHGHQEDGYRDGRKDGSYRSRHENGVDTQVRYLSNEFGHQPNVTFLPRANVAGNEHALGRYSLFRWYWS